MSLAACLFISYNIREVGKVEDIKPLVEKRPASNAKVA